MSADVHEKFAFKEEASLFRYCEGNLSFSSTNDDDYNYNRKKMSRDPMSHRIIEKRRRDRMNNCLADLSRLIPTEYLKKGRGRIEKTEIIEMAIRHMKHLHEELRNAKNSRYSENSDNSVPSPPEAPRDASTIVNDQPIIVEHFRLGYLECLSEAMHYLVDVQGYFAGDSLCVQMINHLHKHCDKILKGNILNCPKKQMGEGNNASASLGIARPMSNSPVSSSTGVPSDDNLPNQNYESGAMLRSGQTSFRSPKRYSERSHHQSKKHLELESRSDVELQQNFVLKCRTTENLKEEPVKNYLNPYVPAVNYESGSYIQTGSLSLVDESSFDASSKDDSLNGPSQLREMLTAAPTGHPSPLAKNSTDTKESTSPTTSNSASPTHGGSHKSCPIPKNLSFKSHSVTTGENHEGNPEIVEGSDNHHMMYKFKNNIKQRFSKENREIQDNDSGGELPVKRIKVDESVKYPEPVDFDFKRRLRYASESDAIDVGDISNRLSFGHKSSEKLNKKWEEPGPGIHQQNISKLWTFSPQPSTSFFNGQPAICGKPIGRQGSDSSFNSVTMTASEMTPGVPIFALHAKGSFYIPLTLDHASLAPFLTILGITKTDEETEQTTILHPVTISVNFQSQSSQSPARSLNG